MAEHSASQHGPTLTFLFTDIVDHSTLWDTAPGAMAVALREHDDLVVDVVHSTDGRVVKNAGDGAMAVFEDAGRAVAAAVTIQQALAAREWPVIGRLRVRMGLHVGVAEARDGDYFGPDVIRAARLCDAAYGGQIVASRAVVELAQESAWMDLGPHRLRGFAAPIEVHQVVAAGLDTQFPALRTLDARPNTLPRFRTGFFGRMAEIASIAVLLQSHRLVTLTGIGGCGKTRLAVEVALDRAETFGDGTYFIDLSVVTDVDRLWDAVAAGLEIDVGAMLRAAELPRPLVLRFLSSRDALIVLDNCEHVLDAAADVVDDILDAAPGVTVLATSREGLHLEGERMVQVPSLPFETDAVQLFRDRAAASGATEIDDQTARAICERLDGLPLAIELAAARCGQLGAAEVARRLSDRFQLLTGSNRRVPRQRTLEATLDWSHDQLTSAEQAALRGLSVFSGTFSPAAAERVANADLQRLASLVDKSLVQRADDGRFRLLETVRAYGEQRLLAEGEARAIREAHTDWLLETIDSFSDEEVVLRGPASDEFLRAELDNLYAAMAMAADRGDLTTLARLASYAGLAGGPTDRDSLRPIVAYVVQVLDGGIDGQVRDRALAAYTSVAYLDPERSARVDLWKEAGDRAWDGDDGLAVVALSYVANVLDASAHAQGSAGGSRRARALVERALTIARELGRHWEAIPTLIDAALALNGSEWERGAERAELAVAIQEASGFGPPIAFEFFVEAAGRLTAGRPFSYAELERRMARVGGLDADPIMAVLLAAFCAPDPARPRQPLLIDGRALQGTHPMRVTSVLIATAVLAAREDDWPMAARLLAAASSVGGIFSSEPMVAVYRVTVPLVRAALDKPTRDKLVAEGRALGLLGAIDLAVDWLSTG